MEQNQAPVKELQDIMDNLSDNYTGEDVDIYDNYDGDYEIEESYDGDTAAEELEVYENYSGENDELLDYTGERLTEEALRKSTKRETFTIENTTTHQIVVALNPGSFPVINSVSVYKDANGNLKYKEIGGAELAAPDGLKEGDLMIKFNNPKELKEAGINVDTVLDDGIIYAEDNTHYVKVSASKPEARIRHFLNYIKHNPILVAATHISSDNPALYESGLELKNISPFFLFGEQRVPFQDDFRPQNYNVKKIIVERQYRLDGNTVAVLSIPAQTKATFTLVVGAEANTGKALERKVHKIIHHKPHHRIFRIVRRHRWGRPMFRRFRRFRRA